MESLENRGDEDLRSVFENALRQSEMPLQKLIECLKMITTRETVSRHEMVKCLRHSVEQCKIQLSIDDLLRPYDQDSVFAWSGFVNILDNLSRNTDPYEAIKYPFSSFLLSLFFVSAKMFFVEIFYFAFCFVA